MKKILSFGIITIAAIALTSCSTDEVNDMEMTSQAQAIGFSTYLGNAAQTRGSVTNTDGIKTANTGFGVFATYTGSDSWETTGKTWTPNFMYNQQVTYDNSGNSWSYSPVKYWPTATGEKISFFAYAPYQSGSSNGIEFPAVGSMKGLPSATITLQDPDKMIDFVATSQVDVTKPVSNTSVSFILKHEMTKVNMTASAPKMDSNTKIVISKVTLSNTTASSSTGQLYKKAVYKFPSKSSTTGTWDYSNAGTNGTGELYSSALDLDKILAKSSTTYTPTLGGTSTTGVEITGGTADSNAISIFSKVSDASDSKEHSLFLIPANGSTGLSENTVYVNIEFMTVTPLTTGSSTNVVVKHTKQIALPSGTLKQGYAYKFNLTFNMDAVKLNVSKVDEWSDGSDYTASLGI